MPLAIVGMHRSGTSMLTRMLNLVGLELGPAEKLMGPAFDNPEGFWENLEFVHINELLLHAFGGSWSAPPEWPEDWVADSRLDEIRRAAAALPAKMNLREPWGWKDPRTTVTIAFWRSLWPNLRVVLCVRNPLEVACSLARRDGLSLWTGLRLWLSYHERLFQSVAISECVVCHYEAILEEPEHHLRRILVFCDLPSADETSLARACAGLKAELRHFGADRAALANAGLPPAWLTMYEQLSEKGEFPRSTRPSPISEASVLAFRQALEWEQRAEDAQSRLTDLSRRYEELAHRFEELLHYARDRASWLEAMRERMSARRYRYADQLARWARRLATPWRRGPREVHHTPPSDPGLLQRWGIDARPMETVVAHPSFDQA